MEQPKQTPRGIIKRWLDPSRIPSEKNGKNRSPEYTSYWAMIRRCKKSSFNGFHRYGGRGITICDRWLGPNGFDNFLADMGRKPSPKLELDRIDNDGNYEPNNCRWATRRENMSHMCRSRMIRLGDRVQSLSSWANELGVRRQKIEARLKRGWSVEAALR